MKPIVTNPELDRFPEPVKHKSNLATIYRTRNRGVIRYEVRWHDDQGKRLRETFLDYDDAKAHALAIVKRVADGGADLLTLRGHERFVYERAVAVLRPHGLELDRVAHDHCQLLGLLDGGVTPLP